MNRIKRKWRKWFAIPLAVVLVAGTVMGVQMTREPTPVLASGVTASNIALTGQDTDNDFTFVQFDIGWEYSWRDAENWDAAWVFVKYKESGGDWKHATLSPTDGDHSVTTNNGVAATIDAASDGTGVFLYRSGSGTGSINWDGVKLRWSYGTDDLADDAIVKVKVFAIEMVYIPEGSFVLHSGESDNLLANFNSGNAISSENATAEGDITWDVTEWTWSGAQNSEGTIGGSDALGAGYPKGYQAFYVMKYEISQRQYAEFLNTLTEAQQKTLTGGNDSAEDRSTIPAAGYWAMSGAGNEAVSYRSYIKTGSYTPGSPAIFGCDADGDNIINESNDGGWTAANYISWADGLAYADWAGLRPMTELEYEKICRGSGSAGDEYAWGSTSITQATGISNANQDSEVSSNVANAVYGSRASVQGPLRVGGLTSATDTREQAGASYYGVMEMSGNLWERAVTVAKYAWDETGWHETGAGAFDGQHGDGSLTAVGYADVANWPSPTATGAVYTAYGAGLRGGSWNNSESYLRVSDRLNAAHPNAERDDHSGFRLVRTP